MRCPRCNAMEDRVVDSRLVREGRAVRRRRECGSCGERYTTYETWETRPVLVIKRDGRRVAYDRAKVVAGIAKACEKRPVSLEQIEIVVDGIEQDLARGGIREVSSDAIGTLVLERLREADEVAYVRFASVYRSFQDVDEFLAVLSSLRQERDRLLGGGGRTDAAASDAGREADAAGTADSAPDGDPDDGASQERDGSADR